MKQHCLLRMSFNFFFFPGNSSLPASASHPLTTLIISCGERSKNFGCLLFFPLSLVFEYFFQLFSSPHHKLARTFFLGKKNLLYFCPTQFAMKIDISFFFNQFIVLSIFGLNCKLKIVFLCFQIRRISFN